MPPSRPTTPLDVLRRRRLLTQRELAAKAGIAMSTLSKIERGIERPRIAVMRALAQALGVADPLTVREFRRAIERAEESASDSR
jgi:transcriptional regulator with XRE-family HTH domain